MLLSVYIRELQRSREKYKGTLIEYSVFTVPECKH